MENYTINISVKIEFYYLQSNFHFSHYKSMETISRHSNQSSNPTEKNTHKICRGQCPMQVCRVSASSFLRFLRRIILNSFSKIYPLCLPIKISDLDKSRMKHGVLLNKNICEKNVSQVRQQSETVNLHTFNFKLFPL